MTDLLATKPKEQTLTEYMEGLTPEQKAEVKAQSWGACEMPKNTKTNIGDFDVEISGITSEKNCVTVIARVWDSKTGKQVGFGKNGDVDFERFRFFSPPILVPDGTKREVLDETIGETVELDNFKEDVAEALKKSLDHTIKVAGKTLASENIVEGKVGSTVTTVYSEADPETNVWDGKVERDAVSGEAWSTLRNGNGTTGKDDSATEITVGFSPQDGSSWDRILRGAAGFTNPSIDAGDTISSVVVSLYGFSQNDPNSDTPDVAMVDFTPISETGYSNADYEGMSDNEIAAARITYAGFDNAGYNDWEYTEAAISSYFNKNGKNWVGFRTDYDLDNTAPNGGSDGNITYHRYYASEQSGTTNDPKMVVTHAAATFTPRHAIII